MCGSSGILPAGYFLLLAQEKVTKEKGTLGTAPAAERPVRKGRPGPIDRPSTACDRMRAIHRAHRVLEHAAFSSDLRRGSEGLEKRKSEARPCAFVGAALAAIFFGKAKLAAIAAPTRADKAVALALRDPL
jgi:hypothetical protein